MRLSQILRNATDGGLLFWCPGCKCAHQVKTGEGPGPRWSWNGDADKPVFSPSVLVTNGHYCRHHQQGMGCWCTYNAEEVAAGRDPSGFSCGVCHSFVGCNGAQPGQIIFLGDCTHELAGQTVDLPPWPAREG